MTELVTSGIDALELFKTEIQSDDMVTRVECISRLHIIAYAMGADMALAKLVPVISDCIKGIYCSDDDEILLAFAKNLPRMLAFLPQHSGAATIVPLLELLANEDETVIREAAVESLGKVARSNKADCSDVCYPALMRLFKSDWFSSKLSACGFASYVYPDISLDQKSNVRSFYISCANDDTPMIKRAAALHLHEILRVVEKEHVINDFMPIYHLLSKDETQESVRSKCVDASLALCNLLTEAEANTYIRETLVALATDKSWKVRLAVAKVYGILSKALGKESFSLYLLQPLVLLVLKDQEPDVRKEAVCAMSSIVGLLSTEEIVQTIVPMFSVICKDQVPGVRSALSESISPLAKSLGKEFAQDFLVPLLLELVKDEHSTTRCYATSSIGVLCEVINDSDPSNKHVANLISLLHTLANDSNWRTRLAVLEQVPELSRVYGKDLFEAKLENLFLTFFGDSVYAIRYSLTNKQVGELATALGEEWTVAHLLPRVVSLYTESSSYSNRIVILQSLAKLATVIKSDEDVASLILPTLEKGCRDSVPNVRFTACQVISDMHNRKGLVEFINSRLEPLLSDNDMDVRYYADRASLVTEPLQK